MSEQEQTGSVPFDGKVTTKQFAYSQLIATLTIYHETLIRFHCGLRQETSIIGGKAVSLEEFLEIQKQLMEFICVYNAYLPQSENEAK